MQTQTPLQKLISWRNFQKLPDAQHVFPSVESLRWYLRTHESSLVSRGALIKLRGQWYLIRPTFDQAIVEIATQQTRSNFSVRYDPVQEAGLAC